MKEAISIYLGGEIITPDLCDYDSYKQLGLKCPFCHSPVFLRQGTVYEKGDKQINRDACFAHFKADLEQGELCEARAITKAGREEIEAIKRKSRNQRLRLFERHLLDVITIFEKEQDGWQDLFRFSNEKLKKAALYHPYNKHNKGKQEYMLREYLRFLEKNVRNISKKHLNDFREICIELSGRDKSFTLDIFEKILKTRGDFQFIYDKTIAEIEFQHSVTKELYCFLGNRCSEKLFFDLMKFWCWVGKKDLRDSKKEYLVYIDNPLSFVKKLAEELVQINWRLAFETYNYVRSKVMD